MNYTERQNSKETYHFFRAMLTKVIHIIINHIWTQINYSSPNETHKKIKVLLLSKRRKMWNCKRSFFRNHMNCSLRTSTKGRLFRTFNRASISKAGYVTAVLAFFRAEIRTWEASSFCDFWKMTSRKFTVFHSFLTQALFLFEMCLVRSTIANLCQIILILMLWISVSVALKKW